MCGVYCCLESVDVKRDGKWDVSSSWEAGDGCVKYVVRPNHSLDIGR